MLQNHKSKTTMFSVVILAGGLATRLRPVTETIPKALIEIQGEPFIFHQLRQLEKNNIHKVILCVGYLGEQIEAVVGTGQQFGLTIEYAYDFQQGNALLGTAGAIKKALPLLGENFFVTYGDSYLTCDYYLVQQAFLAQKKLGLMTVFHNQGQWDKSNVKYVNDEILIYDKNLSDATLNHIDYGLGIFHSSAFERVPENAFYDLADLYKLLLAEKQLGSFEVKERFYEIGSFSGIEEMNQLMLSSIGEEIK